MEKQLTQAQKRIADRLRSFGYELQIIEFIGKKVCYRVIDKSDKHCGQICIGAYGGTNSPATQYFTSIGTKLTGNVAYQRMILFI